MAEIRIEKSWMECSDFDCRMDQANEVTLIEKTIEEIIVKQASADPYRCKLCGNKLVFQCKPSIIEYHERDK